MNRTAELKQIKNRLKEIVERHEKFSNAYSGVRRSSEKI